MILTKFNIVDSKIDGGINPETSTTDVSLEDFFLKTAHCAKIIYCTNPSEELKGKVTLTDCETLTKLRALTVDDTLLITKPELTRGVDYRAA